MCSLDLNNCHINNLTNKKISSVFQTGRHRGDIGWRGRVVGWGWSALSVGLRRRFRRRFRRSGRQGLRPPVWAQAALLLLRQTDFGRFFRRRIVRLGGRRLRREAGSNRGPEFEAGVVRLGWNAGTGTCSFHVGCNWPLIVKFELPINGKWHFFLPWVGSTLNNLTIWNLVLIH